MSSPQKSLSPETSWVSSRFLGLSPFGKVVPSLLVREWREGMRIKVGPLLGLSLTVHLSLSSFG